MQLTYTLLPGLHGDASLFPPLLKELQPAQAECIEYPHTIPQTYQSLLHWLTQSLDWSKPRLLIAESFSGPLALKLAKFFPETIKGIVLAASFCASPTHPALALLPIRPLLSLTPPKTVLRHFLIGNHTSTADTQTLQKKLSNIPSKILTQRIRSILSLSSHDCPPAHKTPLLILQASHDNMIPWDAQNQLRTYYEHAQTHWIEAPHLILQHSPEKCATLIKQFTQSLV